MTEAQGAALRLMAKLMAYPSSSWLSSLEGLNDEVQTLADTPETAAFGTAARAFMDQALKAPRDEMAQRYVAVFDHTPAASLYMSWHRYGNDRSQGKAMGALNGLYRTAGYEPLKRDMPDYLPVMLEFFSIAPDWACEAGLNGFGPEIAALQKTLADLGAEHAPLLYLALEPLRQEWPECFKPRQGMDHTLRPMARPEPEPDEPLIPIPKKHE